MGRIKDLYQEQLRDRDVLDVQVLTPMRKSLVGVSALNSELRRIALMRQGVTIDDGDFFVPGDKVICQRNNYDLEIMNGSIGLVKKADAVSRTILVHFLDVNDTVEISGDALLDLDFAYALTVHKVQGSEFPVVISIVSDSHQFMLHRLGRNMLYTMTTRAQKCSYLIGSRETAESTAALSCVERRQTFLSIL